MDKDSKPVSPINIGNIGGDFIYSQNQSGGHTGNNGNTPDAPKHTKPFYIRWQFWTIVAGVVSLLTYLGINPIWKGKPDKPLISNASLKKIDTSDNKAKKIIVKPKKKLKKMNHNDDKKEPINIGHVNGDVVISQNQTGGITAHTVIIPKPIPQIRHLNDEDKKTLNNLAGQTATVYIPMSDEANKYGNEIVDYLKSINSTVSIWSVGEMMGIKKNVRFSLVGNDVYVNPSDQQ